MSTSLVIRFAACTEPYADVAGTSPSTKPHFAGTLETVKVHLVRPHVLPPSGCSSTF